MNKPTLAQGIGVAAVLALTTIPGIHLLRHLLNEAAAISTMSMLLGLAYLGYLLRQSRAKAGKISLAATSLILLIGALAAGVSATGLIILATALIWVVRSLMAYPNFVSAALDCLAQSSKLGQRLLGLWAQRQLCRRCLVLLFDSGVVCVDPAAAEAPETHG